MAEKSKRATTSVPRERERKATSKEATNESQSESKTDSKATTKTAASKKTAAAAKKTAQKKVNVSSTSAKSTKVSKKAAAEAKPKAGSKKAKAAAAQVEAPVTEAAPVEQAAAPVEAVEASEPTPVAAEVPAQVEEAEVAEAAEVSAPQVVEPVATESKEPEAAEPAVTKVEAPAPAPPKRKAKSRSAEAAPTKTKVEVKAAAKAEAKEEVEAETKAREEIEAPANVEAKEEAKADAEPVAKEEPKVEVAKVAPPAETPSTAGKKKPAKKERKKAAKETAATRSQAPLLKNYQFIGVPSFKGQVFETKPTVAPPPPPPVRRQLTLEERLELLQVRFAQLSEPLRKQIQDQLDMSWIYHDSALEGVVYSYQELKTALGPDQTLVQESNIQPVIDEIRRHRQAIELVREHAKKRTPVTVDVVKKIYLTLHPGEGDLKTLKYRKDIPQHRLYFHEYAPPDKIAAKVRQIIDWVNEPEAQKGRNALRVAARAHYDLLRTFPFTHDSGKVARLVMNLLLLQAGYEPAIIHSTERQRYYEALKGSAQTIIQMVVEAEENAVMSLEKLLDERSRLRSFG